ncbi:MAG TPA: hypothetical protein VLF67_05045 [Candidatus Saccharimonas sp.]|nr:hypothetical protein [Candidatus Saccharimonas sp.]
MIGLLLLASALALGWGLVRLLRLPLYPFEVAALSIILGLLGWTWLACLLSIAAPYTLSVPIATALAAVSGVWLWWRYRPDPDHVRLTASPRRWVGWGVLTAGLSLGFGWLLWTHSLPATPDGLFSAGSTWADLGLHSALITHQAAPAQLPLDLPLASGTHLTYPFLIDFTSALLVRAGWSLHAAIFWPSLLLILAALQLFIGLSLRLFNSLPAAAMSLCLFLCNGSAAGLDAAWQMWRSSGLSLGQFLSHLPANFSAVDNLNAHFNNFTADILLPQRGFLFGLGAFLAIAVLLHAIRQHPSSPFTSRWRLATGVILGLMPLAHAHSFVAAAFLVAAFGLADVWTRPNHWRHWLPAAIAAASLAIPQLAWQQLASPHGSGGHLAVGWMAQSGQSLTSFWWANFGLAGPFLILLPWVLLNPRWRPQLVWYAPMLALLLLSQIYSLQPFEYDDLKLIFYVYLMACLWAGAFIAQLVRRHAGHLLYLAPIILAVTIPGALTVTREFQLHDQFASPDALALSQWVQTHTAPSTVFLTTDKPNQPIATIAGRAIVFGYRGWLYNYHLNYAPRQAAVAAALQGNLHDPAVTAIGAQYLAVAAYEPSEWLVDPTAIGRAATLVYQNPSWSIYRLP